MRLSARLLMLTTLATSSMLPAADDHAVTNAQTSATNALASITTSLDRFRDSAVAAAEGYVHYDGYDTFSMGEHWYNRDVYESGTCQASRPSHLQYLVIGGRRTLIGTGYVCVPPARGSRTRPMFGTAVEWHTHGPAWCLLDNGAAEDYRDLADVLPNKLTNMEWQSICEREGGVPVSQNVNMLHTWNWIPTPGGVFTHENLAIPFLRIGLPVPGIEFLESEHGKAVIRTLKLAHGDTQWWVWRGFNVIDATAEQRRRGWRVLDEAKLGGEAVQHRMIEIGDPNDPRFADLAGEGDALIESMRHQLAAVLSSEQAPLLFDYLDALDTHVQHEQRHH